MALALVALSGTNGEASFDAAIDLVITVNVAAGEIVLAGFMTENLAASDGNSTNHQSLVGSDGVAWTKLGEYTNSEGATYAGVTVSAWMRPRQGSLWSSGGIATLTLSASVTDKVVTSYKCSADVTPVLAAPVVGTLLDSADAFGSASFSGLANRQRIWFRVGGKKANVADTDNLTPSAGFTVLAANRSRNSSEARIGRAEIMVSTDTGATSNPGFAFSGSAASLFVALEEPTATTEHDGVHRGMHRGMNRGMAA